MQNMSSLRVIFFLGFLLSFFPRRLHLFLGAALGNFGFRLLRKRREITVANFALAFPNLDSQQLARACFRHYGICLIEVLLLPYFDRALAPWVRCNGMDIFTSRQKENKGSILLAAHFGNWEVLGISAKICELNFSVLYQKLHSKLADDLFFQIRTGTGIFLIEKKGALKHCIQCLKDGNVFGSVGDQGKGLTAKFFGKETQFPTGFARLAQKIDCRTFFTVCVRNENHLDFQVVEEILTNSEEDEHGSIEKACLQYVQALEALVKKYPEQYFWMHDIWRRFKKGE
jgi:Kdo2-lipid IVA lauroyltransferase/acyltransferase